MLPEIWGGIKNMNKLKKPFLFTPLIFLTLIGTLSILIHVMTSARKAYDMGALSTLNLFTIEDGTYTGSEDGGIVKASVEVLVENHTLMDVKILSHECGTGKKAEIIVNDMVEQNSITVDAVSGATYSSNVIKMAVYNALAPSSD